jgi:hypothetical protein
VIFSFESSVYLVSTFNENVTFGVEVPPTVYAILSHPDQLLWAFPPNIEGVPADGNPICALVIVGSL